MRSLLLLVAALASSALALGNVGGQSTQADIVVGAHRCTWGPSYWCHGLKESAECGATKHCIENKWKEMQVDEDNDEVCDICRRMVGQARDQLRSNETLEELKEVFDGSCDLIPVKAIAVECKTLSEEFIVQLVETLSSEMNPQVVCATAGLCNNARIDALLSSYHSTVPTKSYCDACKIESKRIAGKIEDMTRDKLEDKVLELCGYMGVYSDACKTSVTDDFDVIYDILTSIGDGHLCELAGICSNSLVSMNRPAPLFFGKQDKEGVQCEFCQDIIQHWVSEWSSDTTESEFKTVLEKLCKKVDRSKPDRLKRCLHLVDAYYIPWFHMLVREVNPKVVCGAVGLCTKGKFMQVDKDTHISLLLDTHLNDDTEVNIDDVQPVIDTNTLIGGYFVPQTELALSKPGCPICEFVLDRIYAAIEASDAPRTEDNVRQAVEDVCKTMPKSVRAQCDTMVERYAVALTQMISHGVEKAEICSRLQLCSSSSAEHFLKGADDQGSSNAVKDVKAKMDQCAMCEFALTEVYSMLNDSTDVHEVQNVLDTICYHLPHAVSGPCQAFVNQYTQELVHLIVSNSNPDQVCSELKMCSGSHVTPTPKAPKEKCVLCHFAVKQLDSMIEDKQNQAQMKAALDKLCSVMPSSLSSQCQKFVDDYEQVLLELLAEDLTPDQVCQALGLCEADEVTVEEEEDSDELRVNDTPDKDDRQCTLCEMAVGEIENILEDKKDEDQVKKALEKVCKIMTGSLQQECKLMVDQYLDKIIQLFISEYTPEQICQEIKLCAKTIDSNVISTNEIPDEDASMIKVHGHGPLCPMCEFAVFYLEKNLVNNRSLDMAERAVQMMCAYMPQSIAEPCEEFVDEYGDELIKLIVENELDPKDFCRQLGACTGDKKAVRMYDARSVGGRRCTWGPTYWCQSVVHARACGTLEHCRQNVWNH